MPWVGDISEEIDDLFGSLDSYIVPEDGLSGLGSTIPAKVVPYFGLADRRWGCRMCGGPCAIMGKRWPHRRCLKCKPLKRVYNPNAFPCGHPRTAENTQVFRVTETRCKTCNRRKALEAHHVKRAAAPAPMTVAERHFARRGHVYRPRRRKQGVECVTCRAEYDKRRATSASSK